VPVPDAPTLAVFVAAALTLLLIPGPAVLYIVARSIDRGRSAGLVSTLGIATGSLVHVAAAALGLSSLLVSSATAFEVVKYAGALYLVYLGLRTLLSGGGTHADDAGSQRSLRSMYAQGVVVNVLNPKTALFFFAFLPQFVDVKAGAVGFQIALLGLVFVTLGIFSDGLWAVVAGTASGWLRGSARFLRVQRYASGTALVGLGVATAVAGGRKS
jgi:threonine/homoserine/homoserine lactone efflux protein